MNAWKHQTRASSYFLIVTFSTLLCITVLRTLLIQLFNIVLLQLILLGVAPVGRILVYVFPNKQSNQNGHGNQGKNRLKIFCKHGYRGTWNEECLGNKCEEEARRTENNMAGHTKHHKRSNYKHHEMGRQRIKKSVLIVLLYKEIVRPRLEYCIQAWRPYRRKDIDTFEKIHRRATKLIPVLRDKILHCTQYLLTRKVTCWTGAERGTTGQSVWMSRWQLSCQPVTCWHAAKDMSSCQNKYDGSLMIWPLPLVGLATISTNTHTAIIGLPYLSISKQLQCHTCNSSGT